LLGAWSVGRLGFDKEACVRHIAIAWLIAALLSGLAGLLQYFGYADALAPGWINHTEPGLAYGNLRQRNQFATLTSIGLFALLYIAGTPWLPHAPRLRKALLCIALLVLAMGNAASSSRTGALQWVLVAVLAWFWGRRQSPATADWATWAVAVYVLSNLALPAVLENLTGISSTNALERFQEQSGCASRTVLWANVIHLIAQKPWWGWGWGELKFAHFMAAYPGARFCEILDNAHNLPLHIAVSLGVPVASMMLALCAGAVWRAKPWLETRAGHQMAWGVIAVLGLHSLLEYPLWYGPFQMSLLLCVALLWPPGESATRRVACTVVAGWLLAVLAYAAWDYWRVGQLYLPVNQRHADYQEGPLEKVRNSWLFKGEVRFAEVTTTTPSPENAERLYAQALQTLHFSPEPAVITPLLQSAKLLGADDEAVARIRAQAHKVYPEVF
jgi:O-antigen ligase